MPMKKSLLIILSLMLMPALAIAGDDGESLFKSQGCTSCHRPDKSTKVNPSLAAIAESYRDNTEQLVRYLNGEADAIVKPDKAKLMKRYIERTKKLSASERKAIADYIMSYKK
jgi:cytochrome c551/c552